MFEQIKWAMFKFEQQVKMKIQLAAQSNAITVKIFVKKERENSQSWAILCICVYVRAFACAFMHSTMPFALFKMRQLYRLYTLRIQ